MVNKYSRAQRRHDRARIKSKRQYHWGYGHKNGWNVWPMVDCKRGHIYYMSNRQAGLILNTSTPCSCWMCGNPRQTLSNGSSLTMQERRALDNFKDDSGGESNA